MVNVNGYIDKNVPSENFIVSCWHGFVNYANDFFDSQDAYRPPFVKEKEANVPRNIDLLIDEYNIAKNQFNTADHEYIESAILRLSRAERLLDIYIKEQNDLKFKDIS